MARFGIDWELPKGWQVKEVRTLVREMKPGFACSKNHMVDEGVPHLRPHNIGEFGRLELNGLVQIPESVADLEVYSLRAGDVLFNNTNSDALVGKTIVIQEDLPFVFSNHITRIRVEEALCLPGWLGLCLRALWQQGFFRRQSTKWVNQAGFSTARLAELEIPLPPLAEQARIVAKLEHIERARRAQKQAIEQTQALLKAALAQVFDGTMPDGWVWTKVRHMGDPQREVVQTGPFGAQLKSSEFVKEGIPVLAIGNVQWGYLDISELNHVTKEKAEKLQRYKVEPGDVLFARMGTVGRCCLVPHYASGWLISYHLLRIALDHSHCLPAFFLYCIQGCRQVQQQLAGKIHGATRPGVNTKILAELEIPLPPLPVQQRIITKLDRIQQALKLQREALQKIDALMQSALHKAFRGEL